MDTQNCDDDLPDGWTEWVTDEGRKFYHHEASDSTQWERPTSASVPPGTTHHDPGDKWEQAECPLPQPKAAVSNPWDEMSSNVVDEGDVTGFRGPKPKPPPAGQHIPCLLHQAVHWLWHPTVKGDGLYVDCTFGRGGHSREILSRLTEKGKLVAFDVDPTAIAVARALEQQDRRFRVVHRPFSSLANELADSTLSGVLLDLGVSSPQLDEQQRGFSVSEHGPLDLRMNPQVGIPAAQFLEKVSEEELAWVIHAYGEDEDHFLAERIATTIHERMRLKGPITSTKTLADVVRRAKGNVDDRGVHPAKLTFQGIRVFLNQEMEQLGGALHGAFQRLSMGGRCVIISFKRKEANAIRKFTREHEEPPVPHKNRPWDWRELSDARLCELYPLLLSQLDFKIVVDLEPINPSTEERTQNPRSRSARVHVLKKEPRSWPCLHHAISAVRSLDKRLQRPAYQPVFAGAQPVAAEPRAASPACSETSAAEVATPPAGGPSQSASSTETWLAAAREAKEPASVLSNYSLHQVVEDYNVYGGQSVEGYLDLAKGDLVRVLFKGCDGEEAGWDYGRSVSGKVGWFPSSIALAVPEPGT